MSSLSRFYLLVVILAALLPIGCGGGSSDDSADQDTSEQSTVSAVRITPSAASIFVLPSETKTFPLSLEVLYSDGSIATASGVAWNGSTIDVGAVDDTGVVTASGSAQGTITVAADWDGWFAERDIAVYFGEEIFISMAATASESMAEGEEGAAGDAPNWEYPEDGTLFPARLTPPLIQWNAGTGDHVAYQLTLSRGTDFRVVVYTTSTEFQPTSAQWLELGRSYGEPIQMELVGKPVVDTETPRFKAPARTVTTADAALAGLVFYRSIEDMNVMRINTGEGLAAVPLLDRPLTTENCHGCHAAAQDGSRVFFAFWNNFNPKTAISNTWASEPLALDNFATPTGLDLEPRASFVTLDPTGTRMVSLHYEQYDPNNPTRIVGGMALSDVTPDLVGGIQRLADLSTLAEVPCDMASNGACTIAYDGHLPAKLLPAVPSWSPDGSRLAYVARSFRADWAYTGGDLRLMNWDRDNQEFDSTSLLTYAGTTIDDRTLSYPSWSPDSKWLAVLQGPYTERHAESSFIYLVDPETGTMTRLVSGAADGLSGHPAFTPFIEGGHYWILFHSIRPYGHQLPEKSPPGVAKQLWVMAVDSDAENGVDASHPAFWLPGQNLATNNIQGAWTRPACRPDGDACSADTDCCDGLSCDTFSQTCTPKDSCVMPSLPCQSDADCCAQSPDVMCRPALDGVNVCQITAPQVPLP